MHWLDQGVGKPFYAEFLLEAIGDYLDGEANREYLSFYGRQGSGSRWSLYERAEFDLGHKWEDRPNANSSQLSNVLFSGSYMLYRSHVARPDDAVFERWKYVTPNFSLRMSNLAAAVARPQFGSVLADRCRRWNERYAWLAAALTKRTADNA